MVKSMTVWIVNLSLVAMTVVMFAFPSPKEFTEAFSGPPQSPQIEITPVADEAVVELASTRSVAAEPVVVVVEYDRATACLNDYRVSGLRGVEDCMDDLAQHIIAYDQRMNPIAEAGQIVIPDPEIEQMRLAVTRLCRAKWSATGNHRDGPELETCNAVMQGVAY